MKRLLIPLMFGLGVALALVIGRRMSTDAMAVVVGVAVGVASSIPTSLLLIALLRRERVMSTPPPEPLASYQSTAQPPNVIVLNPAEFLSNKHQAPPLPKTLSGQHPISIIGETIDRHP